MEHFFTCPYCLSTISMVLEPIEDLQSYIEDCEVCCNPIQITFSGNATDLSTFECLKVQ